MEGADRVIAHNVCSLNKNLALTAALHRISEDALLDRTSSCGIMTWRGRRRAIGDELHEGYPWDLLRKDWPWAEQVVVSEPRRDELAELLGVPASRIRVIPNGVDVKQFLKLEPQTEQLRQQLGLSAAAPLMLLPVRITPRKNIELALRVLAQLRNQFPEARLVVTGPLGPHNPANRQYFDRLLALRAELQLEDAAHFLAEVSDQSIPDEVVADLYKLADLLILPSREEGFGIPVLEAGLAGIPVFCADIAALRELGGAQANYFSPDEAPEVVAGQIADVLRSSPVYGLRKRVLREYTWDQVYRNHIAPLLEKG